MDEQIFLDWQIRFNLRKPKSSKATIVYAVATLNGQQIKINTGIKVYASHWDKNKQIVRVCGGLTVLDAKNNGIANKKIIEVITQVDNLKQYLCEHTELLADEAKVKALLVEYINPKIVKTMTMKKDIGNTSASAIFIPLILRFWDGDKQGTRQKLSVVREFCSWLEANGGNMLQNVSKKTLALYELYLNTTPTTRSSIGAEYKTVKTKMGHIMSVIRKAKELEEFPYDLNIGVETYKLQTKKLKDDEYSRSFALSYDEVEQLYAYQGLSEEEEEIRDLFVLQCEMGQRISTMFLWLKGEYREEGTFFEMMSTKTKREVAIPITNRINEIREKYSGGFELMKKQNENTIINIIDRKIKGIAKKVGLNRNHTYQTQIAETVFEKTDMIYILMKSHIARHTFITQRLREGWSKDEIMLVSGHENEDMINYVYAHLTKEDKKETITKRINKVEEEKVLNDSDCINPISSNNAVLLAEIKKQAVENYKQKQDIKKKEEGIRQLSDINAVISQHDEYVGRKLNELMEYGCLSGADEELDYDIPTENDL